MKNILTMLTLFFFAAFLNAQLKPFGLPGKLITSLAIEETDYKSNVWGYPLESIFAGTGDGGVFKAPISNESPEWISIGLEGKPVRALKLKYWSFGPSDGMKLFVAVKPDFQQGDSVLIYRKEMNEDVGWDTNWVAADIGINKNIKINCLSCYYFFSHSAIEPNLMGGEYGLYKGEWDGAKWVPSNIDSIPIKINDIDVNRHWFGNIAWAVGSIPGYPVAFYSENSGTTWKAIPLPVFQGEALSVAINPRYLDSLYKFDSVYINVNGKLFLTPDNGKTFQLLSFPDGNIIDVIAVDPLKPENIFAGAWDSSENHGTFFHSTNSGKDWQQVIPPSSEQFARISSIVVFKKGPIYRDSVNNESFTFIGTLGSGVWLYKYPNPVIPVELISFTANIRDKKVVLNWATATETQNFGWDIERKSGREPSWKKIAFKPGEGNRTETSYYSFIDENILPDKMQYRLKQIDYDGTFKYSREIEVNVNTNLKEFVLYQNVPNPFNPATTIKYALPSDEKVVIKLFDILGREKATLVNEIKNAGEHSVDFNAGNLSSGIYFYSITAGDPASGTGFTQTKKMILLR